MHERTSQFIVDFCLPVVQNCMCFLRTFVFLLKILTSQILDSRISVLEIVRWSRDCKFIKMKVFSGYSSVLTKLWQKGGRFPTIHNASSPNCLLWRLLVDFQATNPSVSTWHAVELWVLAARLLCLAKASRLLASCQLAWQRVENHPQICISNSKFPAAQQTKLRWARVWVYLSRCRLRYFKTSRILGNQPEISALGLHSQIAGGLQGWLLWRHARYFLHVQQSQFPVDPKMETPLVKAGSVRNGGKASKNSYCADAILAREEWNQNMWQEEIYRYQAGAAAPGADSCQSRWMPKRGLWNHGKLVLGQGPGKNLQTCREKSPFWRRYVF